MFFAKLFVRGDANKVGLDGGLLSNDTIIIQYLLNVFYKIENKAFNYKVKLDTTISVDYWRKKVEEREKLKE